MPIVALRKESVDRKTVTSCRISRFAVSLSARRAWIEKLERYPRGIAALESLSARRAWIEKLTGTDNYTKAISVALRKESVDRKVQ